MAVEDFSFFQKSRTLLGEFDRSRPRAYPSLMPDRVKRTVRLPLEVIEAARQRGVPLSDYLLELHVHQRTARVAFVASIFRGFALLELARVPVDPAYYDLVQGVLGQEVGREFRNLAGSGIPHALTMASARLLGADTRTQAVKAVLLSAQRANVLHEGFLEAARLLEATFYR